MKRTRQGEFIVEDHPVYINDPELAEFYLYNFCADDLLEFMSYLNKQGKNQEAVEEIFNDYDLFLSLYDIFLNSVE